VLLKFTQRISQTWRNQTENIHERNAKPKALSNRHAKYIICDAEAATTVH
jgi:hypothetical protein